MKWIGGMEMKPAICSKCGKDLKDVVPLDATNIECFACYEAARRTRKRKDRNDDQ